MPASSPEEIPGMIAQAFNTNDPQAMLDLFEPTGVLITPPSGKPVAGIAAVTNELMAMFQVIRSADIEMTSAVRSGDLAMTHADWKLQGVEADGTPVELAGRGTVVSRLQPDATWRIVFDDPVGV